MQQLRPRVHAPALRRAFCGRILQRATKNGSKCTAFFKLGGQSGSSAGIYGAQGRDDYMEDDVEQYFNYMGMLAEEGTYDRMYALIASGLHPADILLLWAAGENDTPKVAELLRAGADVAAKNLEGKSPLELATAEEVLSLLRDPASAATWEQ